MREDALDHHWIFDRSDDLQVTAALRAAFDIDVEQPWASRQFPTAR